MRPDVSRRKLVKQMGAAVALVPLWRGVTAAAAGAAIPFESAEVTGSDKGPFTIRWRASGIRSVKVYATTAAAGGSRARMVGSGTDAGALTVAALPAAARWYFELVPDVGAPLVVADRVLYLEAAPNFRDAGGYRTACGRWVRSGLVYRSDQLDQLDDTQLERVGRLGVKWVCDLRSREERQRSPDRLPHDTLGFFADTPLDAEGVAIFTALADPKSDNPVLSDRVLWRRAMSQTYRRMVERPVSREALGAVLRRAGDPRQLPMVFHCAGGRDRTGWAAAVFQRLLGVPRQVVSQDYVLSNERLRTRSQASRRKLSARLSPEMVEEISSLQVEYLDSAFDEATRRYGSFERFVTEGLGVSDADVARLRSLHLTGS